MPKGIGIIQARMGSTRLPGKSMKILGKKPILQHVIDRAKAAKTLDKIVLATSMAKENDILEELARESGIEVFRGPEEDVLGRFVLAGKKYNADIVVRICADNPLIAPEEIDRIVEHHIKTRADYSFNHIPKLNNNYPDGLGCEVMNFSILEEIHHLTSEKSHQEHVTEYIWDNKERYNIATVKAPPEITGPDIKLDVDTEEDLRKMKVLIGALPENRDGLWSAREIVKTYRECFHTKSLFLLESEHQAEKCINVYNETGGEKWLIALTPSAMHALEKRGVDFLIVDDFYEKNEIYEIGLKNYDGWKACAT